AASGGSLTGLVTSLLTFRRMPNNSALLAVNRFSPTSLRRNGAEPRGPAFSGMVTMARQSLHSSEFLETLSARSQDIFRRLVERYLETGEPVGSRAISRMLDMQLSPASVRNVMADLEDLGLIAAPHTSAGRAPTQEGLRFFVDAMLEVGAMDEGERDQIARTVSGGAQGGRVEDLLNEASALLSRLSHGAGMQIAAKADRVLKHLEFVRLDPERAMSILVAQDGQVENRIVPLPPGLTASALTQASNF